MINRRKISIAAMTAILVAGGYGGYTIIKEKELEGLRTSNVPMYEVARVIDGDTFELADGDRVRLIGSNSPEKGECFFEESKNALKELIEGKEVELRKDVTTMDEFGRLLRYVILPNASTVKDNILVSEYMVENGYAILQNNSHNMLYYRILINKRDEAIKMERGMWSVCDYAISERSQTDAPAPSEQCSIKGNISMNNFGKTYFMDGCINYTNVKVDLERGEEYFCSEEEAVEAGFEKSENCP